MLVKARFLMALGLLLQLHQTPALAKAAPLQTLDSLLSDIQILAYDLDEAQIRQLQQQHIPNNFRQNDSKRDDLDSKNTKNNDFNQDRSKKNSLDQNRLKRHIFSNWFLQHQRRSVNDESAQNKKSSTSLSKPDHQRRPEKPNQEDDEHSEVQSATKLDELNFAIRKLQMWEFALHRRFGDRFKDNPQQLAAHPIWQKIMKVRSMLHRLMALAEANRAKMDDTRGLRNERMKK